MDIGKEWICVALHTCALQGETVESRLSGRLWFSGVPLYPTSAGVISNAESQAGPPCTPLSCSFPGRDTLGIQLSWPLPALSLSFPTPAFGLQGSCFDSSLLRLGVSSVLVVFPPSRHPTMGQAFSDTVGRHWRLSVATPHNSFGNSVPVAFEECDKWTQKESGSGLPLNFQFVLPATHPSSFTRFYIMTPYWSRLRWIIRTLLNAKLESIVLCL